MMDNEIISVIVASLVTAGLSALLTVRALTVHIQYLREQLKSQQTATEKLTERIDQNFKLFDEHLRAQYMQFVSMANHQVTPPGALSKFKT